LSLRALADGFNTATAGLNVCLARLPLGWNGAYRHFKHPFDYLGSDGGGGVGAGPGMIVGAALALKDSGRIVAGILGDGDFLMGVTALWTAAHYRIPCLVIVANNRSFFNDELHQERVARERSRPVENRWIGQRISEPDIDLAAMARAQGALGIGPVTEAHELLPANCTGIDAVPWFSPCSARPQASRPAQPAHRAGPRAPSASSCRCRRAARRTTWRACCRRSCSPCSASRWSSRTSPGRRATSRANSSQRRLP